MRTSFRTALFKVISVEDFGAYIGMVIGRSIEAEREMGLGTQKLKAGETGAIKGLILRKSVRKRGMMAPEKGGLSHPSE
ncbi:MAG TPA: hypothetical protein VK463_13805 [Desulfomonilaceae bacterium]|nr:hypothetical protein [Desulfomonilaceae bacterium]